MKLRSPTAEGFRAILREPSLGLAEIAWRWSFGFAATALLAFSFLEYLDTLPVTKGEMFLLRSRQPALISQAFARIFHGSGPRAVAALIVVGLASALAWIVVASLGRAATLKTLQEYFQGRDPGPQPDAESTVPRAQSHLADQNKVRMRTLIGLNSLRVATMLAAAVGWVGATLLASAASPDKDPAPGSATLIFLTVIMLVGLAWVGVNWALSLASIFATEDYDTFGAVRAAIDLYRRHTGAVLAVGTWFGLAHIVAFVLATSVVAFPLALAQVLPAGIVLGGVLLVTLLYFAVVDFLHVGRLAAYLYILVSPDAVLTPTPGTPSPPKTEPVLPPETAIDRDEPILSDLPGALAAG
jgi:hypothetical protein